MTKQEFKTALKEQLRAIGENPDRQGLVDTPERVWDAWVTWFGGYNEDPEKYLRVFEDGAEGVDQLVLQTNIPVYSHCEHHMAPFFGVAHVGYIPNGRVLGLSKINRVVNIYARRLQVQERLTNQIAEALDVSLHPKGVGVVMQCRHLCIESRGVHSRGTTTQTSSLRGVMLSKPEARKEFLDLALQNAPRI